MFGLLSRALRPRRASRINATNEVSTPRRTARLFLPPGATLIDGPLAAVGRRPQRHTTTRTHHRSVNLWTSTRGYDVPTCWERKKHVPRQNQLRAHHGRCAEKDVVCTSSQRHGRVLLGLPAASRARERTDGGHTRRRYGRFVELQRQSHSPDDEALNDQIIDLASLRRLGVSCNRVRPRDRPPRGCEGVKQRRRGRVCAARRAGAFSKDSAETPFRLCLQTL